MIEYLPVGLLARYERNARRHSEAQVSQIVASIQEFGFTNPVLVDDQNVLIAGHGRLAAASDIGMETVPAIRLQGLSEDQIKALRIADNQLALNASWDTDLLAAELADLQGLDFDLDLLGFDDDFLAGLLDDSGQEDEEGEQDEEPAAGDDEQKVSIVLGPYEMSVSRRDWDRWETDVRAAVGFDKADVTAAIKERLGFKK